MHLRSENDLSRYLVVGVTLSLAVHFALLLALQRPALPPAPEPTVFTVTLAPRVLEPASRAPSNRRQIVTPPDAAAQRVTTPAQNAFESDRDVRVEHEQVRRGDRPDAGPAVQPGERTASSVAPPAQQEQKPKPKDPRPSRGEKPASTAPAQGSKIAPLSTLKLDQGTLLEEFGMPAPAAESSPARTALPTTPRPFSRPVGSGAAFIGSFGNSDFLPNLPDGDITLLNAKANQYAVFVRRVATRVFGQLRASGWETLHASDIHALDRFSEVRAVLSPDGALLHVTLTSSGGSARFDEVLEKAVRSGAGDPHPPAGAEASDGNIHFIFRARCWSQMGSDGRHGFPVERRWLMLATGLE